MAMPLINYFIMYVSKLVYQLALGHNSYTRIRESFQQYIIFIYFPKKKSRGQFPVWARSDLSCFCASRSSNSSQNGIFLGRNFTRVRLRLTLALVAPSPLRATTYRFFSVAHGSLSIWHFYLRFWAKSSLSCFFHQSLPLNFLGSYISFSFFFIGGPKDSFIPLLFVLQTPNSTNFFDMDDLSKKRCSNPC